MAGDYKANTYLQTPYVEAHGSFSPDSHFIAYDSNESGRFEIYVQTFPVSDAKWPISTNGGYEPIWRGDGKELFFLDLEHNMMSVEIESDGIKLKPGVPKVLFHTSIIGPSVVSLRHYTLTSDGKRFLLVQPANNTATPPEPAPPIDVILNWTGLLNRK
jgi:hypothetical protein